MKNFFKNLTKKQILESIISFVVCTVILVATFACGFAIGDKDGKSEKHSSALEKESEISSIVEKISESYSEQSGEITSDGEAFFDDEDKLYKTISDIIKDSDVEFETEEELIRKLTYFIKMYKQNYFYEDENLFKDMIYSVLDNYSDYYTEEEYAEITKESQGIREGLVGLTYAKDTLEISSIIFNSPAERAGVKAGGKMISIDSTRTPTYEDFIATLASYDNGVDFSLGVDYDGEVKFYTLCKEAEFTQTYVKYCDSTGTYSFRYDDKRQLSYAFDEGEYYVDLAGDEDVGYIRLTEFSGWINSNYYDVWQTNINGAAGQFTKALSTFKENGKHKLVIDLRDNGGGYMVIAECIASHLIFKGEDGKRQSIATVAYKDGKTEEYVSYVTDYNEYGFTDIVFLANASTASASEVLMGAVLDYDKYNKFNRVKIVLDGAKLTDGSTVYRSYGKGIMQNFYEDTKSGDVVKLTIAQLYWPISKITIHGVGILKELDPTCVFEARDENGNGVDALQKALTLIR